MVKKEIELDTQYRVSPPSELMERARNTHTSPFVTAPRMKLFLWEDVVA